MFVMASADAPSKQRKKREKVLRDSIEISDIADTILRDSLLSANDTMLTLTVDTTLALGVDTTKMDSLQLAIYHHNKAIDDSIRLDSINRQRAGGINSPVNYSANDSLVYDAVTKTARLYGSSTVKYENMDLAAERIHMSIDSSLVHATGAKDKADTTGMTLFGTPVFSMGSDKYESDTMAFNFKTKKGLISNVYTQQEDGFLRSEISKRSPNGDIFLQHGRYTTCDAEHPDFYIALSRAKVRPGKEGVFGPAYLVVADVPLPFAIPYGFFPFTKSYSSGFIMPTYGDESNRGFYLRDGGYYFAISDKMDLKLLGEIYTKGSWGLSAAMNYTKRYRFSGSFYASFQNTQTGDKGMPDFTRQKSFKIQWSHRQDQKANPYSSLSASVNFATSSYERNNLSSLYNPQTLTQSTRTSSVSWSTTFSSIGLSLSSTANLSQNMRDSSIAMTLPDLNISLSRFYPFKRKHAAGQGIHHIRTGRFHDNIPYKAGWKTAVGRQKGTEHSQLFFIRKLIKQEQVSNLLKAKASVSCKSVYQILHIIATIKKPSVAGMGFPVNDFGSTYIRDCGQTGKNTLAVQVTQTAFDIISGK